MAMPLSKLRSRDICQHKDTQEWNRNKLFLITYQFIIYTEKRREHNVLHMKGDIEVAVDVMDSGEEIVNEGGLQ